MATNYTRLSPWVKPISYDLFLFDLTEGEPWTYQGRVDIELALEKQVSEITLHSRYITVHSAELSIHSKGTHETFKAVDIGYDVRYQRCTFSFGRDLPATTGEDKLLLSIRFQGTIGDDLVGFYRSTYESEVGPAANGHDSEHSMYSTQFQPCEARRAFPCFDEPGFKSTFDFSIETPSSMTALSNMPVKDVRASETHVDRTITTFERTPVMSSYLLAWAVGHLEHIEANVERSSSQALPIRLYTTPGLTDRGRFALELAQKIVPYFSEKFQIDFPLPKLDLIAIPDMADSMENWGLLCFETGALLFDAATSDPSSQFEVAYTVAHEIAHQWFGNLVTMQWWDDLWLNEAFATWAGLLATDHLFPQWDVWAKFVNENMQEAFELDSLQSSHPVHVPVDDDLEVDSIFDSISYDKGCSLLRMVVDFLGQDAFLNGVARYLSKHTYQNTVADDLWRALNQSSGKDVIPFIEPWIQQMGFPLIQVGDEIRQNPFGYDNTENPRGKAIAWHVPLKLAAGGDEVVLKQPATPLGHGLKLHELPNVNYTGFFRTNFSPDDVQKLSEHVTMLKVTERVGLITDVLALAMSAQSTVDSVTLLQLLQSFKDEDNYYILNTILSSIEYLQSMFSHNPRIVKGLNECLISLLSATAERLESSALQASAQGVVDYLPVKAKSEVILALGMAGDTKTVAQMTTAFQAFASGDREAIPVSLQPATFQVAIHQIGAEAFRILRREYAQSTSVDGQDNILTAIAQGLKLDLFDSFVNFIFKDKQVGLQEILTAIYGLAANSDIRIRERLWAFIQDNWKMVHARMSGSNVIFERFIQGALETLASRKACASIETFFRDKDTTGYSRGVVIVVEKVGVNARFIERDEKVLEMYFG